MNRHDDNENVLAIKNINTDKRAADVAETLVRATGDRVTTARVHVLRVLLEAGRALSHHQVEQRVVGEMPIDRVTIYRVLQWLTTRLLAHKIVGDDRVWRFHAPAQQRDANQAHFNCVGCGEIVGLQHHITPSAFKVPRGFAARSLEVVVRGHCATCAASVSAAA